MALSDRNTIVYNYDSTNSAYRVYANTFAETTTVNTFNFCPNYQITSYELVESSSAGGVTICTNGAIVCSEFIEGEPS